MATWALTEAKAKLSELIDLAERKEAQEITRHGKAVALIMSMDEARRLKQGTAPARGSMAEFFRKSPLRNSGIDLRRNQSPPRKVDL